MTPPRVLSVGQCGPDNGQIGRFLRDGFRAQVDTADTLDEALAAVRSGHFDLIMVNRIFDLDGTPGLDLIRSIKSDPALAPIPTLLVSNYPDAQSEAVALGALSGFGKSDIGRSKAKEVLGAVLGMAETHRA